jgi:hypothetical protein
MKNKFKGLTIASVLIVGFALTGFQHDAANVAKQEKQKPKATYQVGKAKVVVWENKSSDGTTWKNFEVENVYKAKDGKWKTTNQFDETELLQLKNAIDKAIYGETITEK